MEVEVRVVGGIHSCFVSLPLYLIETLERTRGSALPPLLAFELRSPSGDRWNVAWSGSASTSTAIEVAQRLAECISLQDHTKVQLTVIPVLPKAEFVTIEPSSEDDWEILELNSELAEEAILKQVGVVYEGMKFPLWLHGHIVVEFLVVSSSPKKPIVQLIPGTEVAVAPKKRKVKIGADQDVQKQSSINEQLTRKALLRVQAAEKKHVHSFEFRGVELGVLLTSVAFIHPETATKFSFDNLQLVTILPKILPKETAQNEKDIAQRKGNHFPGTKESNNIITPSKETARQTVVRILYSESVVRGHVMLPHSLRQFIRASLHSWVYIKKYCTNMMKDAPLMTLSPCRFMGHGKNKTGDNNELGTHEKVASLRPNSMNQEESLPFLPNEVLVNGDDDISKYHLKQEIFLVKSWLIGQLKAIASHIGQMEVPLLVLANENLLHFEVIDRKLGSNLKDNVHNDCSLEKGSVVGKSAAELLYLLTVTFEKSHDNNLHENFNFVLDANIDDLDNFDFSLGKLEFSELVTFSSVMESSLSRRSGMTLSSLSWMQKAVSDVIDRLFVLLSPSSWKLLKGLNWPLPGHVLIFGPAGCGKTTLTKAAARYFEEHEEILAHIVHISCSELASEKSRTIRQAIRDYVSEAIVHSPSIVVFDGLDNLVSFSPESEGSQPSNSATALVGFLTDLMDEYREKSWNACGDGPIAFMASAQSLENLPLALVSSGRFDLHVQLSAPAVLERGAMLKHEVEKNVYQCSEDILSEIASKCDGYDAYDLEVLVDRALRAASKRRDSSHDKQKDTLLKEDFLKAMHNFVPVAMRDLKKAASDSRHGGWKDVGGLTATRSVIQEMIELPSKFPSIFAHSPLRLRSNILLYGPPGCGKTHIVGAAAAASSLRFISIKGPEILNKYIGASEQAVRDMFAKAAAAAPCLLFFDEFDSIAPRRGHDNTGVTDRVVNQLLTELDGVETLTGVFVFAATSRPDLLDAALLRPGRFDRLLFCDFPRCDERLDILTVLSGKLSLASDANLEEIAFMTEGFSGADLQALLSDAQLAAVHEILDSGENDKPGQTPVISKEHLKSVASKARPSVSEAEKMRLYEIYSQFSESKKSVSARARDTKGKRATLA
ncbi:peroxisomal ATPase PEX1 isoform X1 [Typha angustifolia]|uniref:peroxisomal ATPase PEX1 isoform X1 n=1 Tax=Typha angustifolia TaxID=59011 RepID=UPI003C306CEF